jgi:ubiquinone/menaquinone biosynthesis C-methylase UbiE
LEKHSKNHNKKKRIIQKYNSTSHFYDKRYRQIQEEKFKIILDKINVNGRVILDLGCGTGLLFEYIKNFLLQKKEIKLNYVGVDISWNMLLEFKSKITKLGCNKNTPNLILSDIDYLPLRNDIFSSLFALTSFQNLPSTKKGINELFRVSRNKANAKFSILRKNLDLDSLLSTLRNRIKKLKITNNENLEDIIFEGMIIKK